MIKGAVKGEMLKFWPENAQRGQVVGLLTGLGLYMLFTPRTGFLLTSVFLFSGLSLMRFPGDTRTKYSWLKAFGTGLLVTALFYVVFKYVLLVPLPVGTLFIGGK